MTDLINAILSALRPAGERRPACNPEATQRVLDCVEGTEGLHPLIASSDCQRREGCSVPLVLTYDFPDQRLEITNDPEVTHAIEDLAQAAGVADMGG